MPGTEPRDIASRFRLRGTPVSAERFGNGHINDTWLVVADGGGASSRYVLQRINRQVFRDPGSLMENVRRVADHIAANAAAGEQTLTLVPTRAGECFHVDAEGEYWRAYRFIAGGRSVEVAANPAQVRDAASMFGQFQGRLCDLPPPALHETIPGFHDTPARYRQFHDALARDSVGRARDCSAEIDLALSFEAGAGVIGELEAAGALPRRIVHNDTKLDNVIFARDSGRPICVVDFDTVMPGTVLSDFGDLVRSATTSAAEGETNLDRVAMRIEYFAALAEGYLSASCGFLTETEIEHLAVAGRVITVETGLRFLTDYLCGDTYFRTHRPQQNLERCRTQFALARSIDAQLPEMRSVVAGISAGLRERPES